MPWSEWHPLEMANLAGEVVPDVPGIYEIRVKREIERVRDSSRLMNIGRTITNLRERVRQKASDNDQLPAPLQWVKMHAGESFEVRWLTAISRNEAKVKEKVRLAQFVSRHWELPPGNDLGPQRIPDIGDHMGGQNPAITAEILESYAAIVGELGPI